jgi:hypothetical protein
MLFFENQLQWVIIPLSLYAFAQAPHLDLLHRMRFICCCRQKHTKLRKLWHILIQPIVRVFGLATERDG